MNIPVRLERKKEEGKDDWMILELETSVKREASKREERLPTLTELLYNQTEEEMLTLTEILD